jgi:hypothetical protein
MEIGKQFLPYKNPYTDTWHRTLADSTPLSDEEAESLNFSNGYLTHHMYTGALVHMNADTYKQHWDNEAAHERAMDSYLNSDRDPQKYDAVVDLHGGNEERAVGALTRYKHEQDESVRQGDMGMELGAGASTGREYLEGMSRGRPTSRSRVLPPETTRIISNKNVEKKPLQ